MILLWKAVMLEVKVKGVQSHPQKLWFAENLGNIPENPHKNGAQHCLTSKNGAQGLQKNTWRSFWRSYQKGLNDLCEREFVDKSCTKTLQWSLEKFGQKSFASPKICLDAPKPMVERPLQPRCSPFERTEGWMPPPCLHLPASLCTFRRPCAHYSTRILLTRCCRLQFVTVMNIISGIIRQQFITAKKRVETVV